MNTHADQAHYLEWAPADALASGLALEAWCERNNLPRPSLAAVASERRRRGMKVDVRPPRKLRFQPKGGAR